MKHSSNWMCIFLFISILVLSGCASLTGRNQSTVASLPELSTDSIADSGASLEGSSLAGNPPAAAPEASPSSSDRKIYESEAVKSEGGGMPDNGRDWNVPASPSAPPSVNPERSPLPDTTATPDIGIVKSESSDTLTNTLAQPKSTVSQSMDRIDEDLSSTIDTTRTSVADPLEIAMGPMAGGGSTPKNDDADGLSFPEGSGYSSTLGEAQSHSSPFEEKSASIPDSAARSGSTVIEDPFSPVASSQQGLTDAVASRSFPEIGSNGPALPGTAFPPVPSSQPPAPSAAGVMRGGQPAPVFSAVTLDGSSFDLVSNRGRVVVLDFWRRTCGPCLKAMPKLASIRQSYGEDKLVILGLNTDERRVEAETFLRQHPHNWHNVHVLSQKTNLLNPYMIRLLPTFVVIDQVGNIQYRGGDINQVSSKVAELIANPSLPKSSLVASLR